MKLYQLTRSGFDVLVRWHAWSLNFADLLLVDRRPAWIPRES
jgi:hypothetical protein